MMQEKEWKALSDRYIAGTYARADALFVRGQGSLLYDMEGKRYIDLCSGIGVNIFGAADPVWVRAVTEQAALLQHVSNLYYTEPQTLLARALCQKTGMDRVFFCNSGAEANECAIKTARKYASDRYGPERNVIITLKNSFHGRTVTTISATGQEVFHKDFGPFTGGFVYVEPGDQGELRRLAEEYPVCAIMAEMVLGEGGVQALPQSFVDEMMKLAREKDILIIDDEVQTGNGRTGRYFCCENYGLKPDIISTAKGLGGGLPIGATLFGEKTKDVLTPGTHGSTFGGNPVCAAGALSIVERVDEALLAGVEERGRYLRQELEGAPGVLSVSGMGLMAGIETKGPAPEIVKACLGRGVVLLTAKEKLRLLPPLNIPMELLKEATAILKEEIARASS
ncbi:MAG: acetylornithine transaminase [Bacillota bacterium]|nr:acetylornithine transaminase [Bacillota bacterium]